MKSAKEMFEELGYEYHEEDDMVKGKIITYEKAIHTPDKINTNFINFKKITFALNGFETEQFVTDAYINRIKTINNVFINIEELQAINKQVKELQWNK